MSPARTNSRKPSRRATTVGKKQPATRQSKWTWLVYMAGDNNLADAGRADLKEMMRVGSTRDVQVLAQFDTARGTTRYHVARSALQPLATFRSTNTGSPAALANFIAWGLKQYPGERVLVDVWNHGGGWEDLPRNYDYEAIARSGRPMRLAKLHRVRRSLFRTTAQKVVRSPQRERAILIDCGAHDFLDNQELRSALKKGMGPGRKVDVLGMDACLMNMIEVAYEMRDVARVQVGSEQTEPEAGWPYASILRSLVASPDMEAADLAKRIAAEYRRSYTNAEPTTQSVLDLAQVPTVAKAVDRLAQELLADFDRVLDPVVLAFNRTLSFEDSPEYLDLGDFANQLIAHLPETSAARAAASQLCAALSTGHPRPFVLANETTSASMKRASGASIYFPGMKPVLGNYRNLQFCRDNHWPQFLEKFANA